MEKHNYTGKTKEEAIQNAKEDLQEVEENLFIKELGESKGGLFKSKKVEIEVVEKREVVKHIKEYLVQILKSMGFNVNNDMFKEHSQYFRNALVRRNYGDIPKGIYPTSILYPLNGTFIIFVSVKFNPPIIKVFWLNQLTRFYKRIQ